MASYIAILQNDLANGFSKRELEILIGLPKNSLASILTGKRTLSLKSQLKIKRWEASEKPNPLDIQNKASRDCLIEQLDENNKPENRKKIEQERNTVSPKNNIHYPLTIKEAAPDNSTLDYCEPCAQITKHIFGNCQKCEIPPPPVKKPDENAIDFAIRKNEWKAKYNKL